MDDLNQILPPVSSENDRRPVNRVGIILIIAVILVVAGLVYLGRQYEKRVVPPAPPAGGLTDSQKAEILKSLASSPKTPPFTDAQKAEILKSLAASPKAPPLTEAEKARIIDSLSR